MEPIGAPIDFHWVNDPLQTHNRLWFAIMIPIWPQINLNNPRLSGKCLKGPQFNQFCRLPSTSETFFPKKATSHALWL